MYLNRINYYAEDEVLQDKQISKEDIINRVFNEDLPPNHAELAATKKVDPSGNVIGSGIAVDGSLDGTKMRDLYEKFRNALPEQKRNLVNYTALFGAWLQKNEADVWQAIQEHGGFDKLLVNGEMPDIIIIDLGNGKRAIKIAEKA